MGIPFKGYDDDDDDDDYHAFVRIGGTELCVEGDYDVVSCSHCCINGPVTEALVSGPGAHSHLSRTCPNILKLVRVTCPEWVEEAILVASGASISPGTLAVKALRAPRRELTLVSHPRAPCGAEILGKLGHLLAKLGLEG